MAADESLNAASWFDPGTYSVWAERPDPDENHKPALLVLYEWEILGMRGLHLVEAWGALSDLQPGSENKWSSYEGLRDEAFADPATRHSLGLVRMIHSGHLKRIGKMPALPGFTEPPSEAKIEAAVVAQVPPVDRPIDSHP